jgi:DNA modification methylase
VIEIAGAHFHVGDCLDVLKTLPDCSVQMCVTSPPYFGLRDYQVDGQIGLEQSPDEYIAKLVSVFGEVRRVLRDDGTLWVNIGDSYAGSWGAQGRQGKTGELAGRNVCAARQIAAAAKRQSGTGSLERTPGLKNKDLIGIPWTLAFALRADGWYLRSDIIWSKGNPMPESVRDRPTKSHEYLFLLSKSERYFYDHEAVKEPAVCGHPSGNGFVRESRLTYQNKDGSPRGNSKQWTPKVTEDRKDLHGPTYSRHRSRIPGGQSLQSAPNGYRNRRSVWHINTKPFKGAHFATFPPDLVEPCVLAGSRPGDTVLDPFGGAGTTALVALRNDRKAISMELNPDYVKLAIDRIRMDERANQTRLIA